MTIKVLSILEVIACVMSPAHAKGTSLVLYLFYYYMMCLSSYLMCIFGMSATLHGIVIYNSS